MAILKIEIYMRGMIRSLKFDPRGWMLDRWEIAPKGQNIVAGGNASGGGFPKNILVP
jgi:hypothetical protein